MEVWPTILSLQDVPLKAAFLTSEGRFVKTSDVPNKHDEYEVVKIGDDGKPDEVDWGTYLLKGSSIAIICPKEPIPDESRTIAYLTIMSPRIWVDDSGLSRVDSYFASYKPKGEKK